MDGLPRLPPAAPPGKGLWTRLAAGAAAALHAPAPRTRAARAALPRPRYAAVRVRPAENWTATPLRRALLRDLSARIAGHLEAAGLPAPRRGAPAATITPRLLAHAPDRGPSILALAIADTPTGHPVDEKTVALPGATLPALAEAAARRLLPRLAPALTAPGQAPGFATVTHGWCPVRDPDVPLFTDLTLGTPPPAGGAAILTLYAVEPPLAAAGTPIDMSTPARLVQSAFANQVSTLATDDPAARPVPPHPIGHFFIRLEVPGHPPLLTGMTTTARADMELAALTIGRHLGLGGILLTPEPGRLNGAAEALRELTLRQHPLRATDPRTGAQHRIADGAVVFARIRVPPRNGADALAFLAGYIRTGQHRRFGALQDRAHHGTGAGCAAFAMAILAAAGIVPFVADPPPEAWPRLPPGPAGLWRQVIDRRRIPWPHVGADERTGAPHTIEAALTFFDLLFHRAGPLGTARILAAVEARLRARNGRLPALLFRLAAPLAPFAIARLRKDPHDRAPDAWARPGEGLEITFWNNLRFAAWIRRLWAEGPADPRIALAREGRFHGIELDATDAPRQRERGLPG